MGGISHAIATIIQQRTVVMHGETFPGSGQQANPADELTRLKRELARVTEAGDI